MKAYVPVIDMWMAKVYSYRYLVTRSQNWTHHCTPIMWQIGVRRTNHGQFIDMRKVIMIIKLIIIIILIIKIVILIIAVVMIKTPLSFKVLY